MSSSHSPVATTFAMLTLAAVFVMPPAPAAAMPSEERDAEAAGPHAAEGAPAEPLSAPPANVVVFDRLLVVGSPDRLAEIPGSAHFISEQELRAFNHSDIHRVLRSVPGVNMQEEEGYGLRPNIGMRGTGVERSQKITVLEDGVLIAPAPYSAPAAYYFPTVGRMEAVEVRKGSAAIRQGPFTNGGVLGFVSAGIPSDFSAHVTAAVGEDDLQRAHVKLGDTHGRFGWLLQSYLFETDGFKQLDGGGSTGTDLEDYMVKLRWESAPGGRAHQAWELKLGRTDQDGDETYLGLTQEDFDRQPLRRYAASQEDRISTRHEQVQVRHLLQTSGRWDLTTTAYRNDFFRNWHKLDSVLGRRLTSVLDDPETFERELAILRGEADSPADALSVRNNRRDYYGAGAQSVLGLRLAGGALRHDLEIGVRYHEDEEDRFQEDERFQMIGGRMVLTSVRPPGSNANRVSSASAWAVHAADRISRGRFTVTPGLRFETIEFRRLDYGTSDPTRTGARLGRAANGVEVLLPGLAIDYRLGAEASVFAGVHRGFAPPGPGADTDTEAEESDNYEVGWRLLGSPLASEVVAFFNDYDNLLGRDTLSGGGAGTGDLFNGGQVEVRGLEASLAYDWGKARGSSYGLPLRLVYTYTHAQFGSSFETVFEDWAPRVERGDELPYIPAHQGSLSLGIIDDRWSAHVSTSYVDRMRTKAGQGGVSRLETTDAHWLVDLAAHYRLLSGLELFAELRNATDEVYVAARRPAGARPSLPRTAVFGVAVDF